MTYIALLHLISFQVQKKIAVFLFLYKMRRNKQSKLKWAFIMIIITKKWKKSAWWNPCYLYTRDRNVQKY